MWNSNTSRFTYGWTRQCPSPPTLLLVLIPQRLVQNVKTQSRPVALEGVTYIKDKFSKQKSHHMSLSHIILWNFIMTWDTIMKLLLQVVTVHRALWSQPGLFGPRVRNYLFIAPAPLFHSFWLCCWFFATVMMLLWRPSPAVYFYLLWAKKVLNAILGNSVTAVCGRQAFKFGSLT